MSRFEGLTAEILRRHQRLVVARAKYQRLAPAILEMYKRDTFRFGASGRNYEERMNLPEELASLPAKSVVWDLGGGTFVAPREMLETDVYGHLRFAGNDFVELPDPWDQKLPSEYDPMGTPPRFTFIPGLLEELGSTVADQAREREFYPPTVLLASNVLHYPAENDTLDIVVEEIGKVMGSSAKLLVYEDGQYSYSKYRKILLSLGLAVAEFPCIGGHGKYYLRVTCRR